MSSSALIVSGEASGERYGGSLVSVLQERLPLHWFGLGGDAMQAAGVELLAHARELAVVGLSEAIAGLPRFLRVFRQVLQEVDRRQPRFAVLIDFPDFNLRLARRLKDRGVPVVYFVSPQLWAWRRGRIRAIKNTVSHMLCIFPFEEAIYRKAGVPVTYVGHPLVDVARTTLGREEFLRRQGLDSSRPVVALLPGSRAREIHHHLPTILRAAEQLEATHGAQFLLPQASTVEASLLARIIAERPVGKRIQIVSGDIYNSLGAADLAIVSSGTATVEAALLRTPMIVVYRVSAASAMVLRRLIRTPYYSMVNLIAGRAMVPELIQEKFTTELLVKEAAALLDSPHARQAMQSSLAEVARKLGSAGAIERAATVITSLFAAPQTQPNSATRATRTE
jgi:lipid-A-disaccharide synthase